MYPNYDICLLLYYKLLYLYLIDSDSELSLQ